MSSGIHRAAAVGFDASADAYERGRPGFPEEAVEKLVAQLRIQSGATGTWPRMLAFSRVQFIKKR